LLTKVMHFLMCVVNFNFESHNENGPAKIIKTLVAKALLFLKVMYRYL